MTYTNCHVCGARNLTCNEIFYTCKICGHTHIHDHEKYIKMVEI